MGFDSRDMGQAKTEEQSIASGAAAKGAIGPTGHCQEQVWDRSLVVLDSRVLGRECLIGSLAAHRIRMHVAGAASMQEWKSVENLHPRLPQFCSMLVGANLPTRTW